MLRGTAPQDGAGGSSANSIQHDPG
jgi:hypothetical protein